MSEKINRWKPITMNIFTTDHPLTDQACCFDSQKCPRRSFICQTFVTATFLFVPLSAILLWTLITENEDVPAPSWTDCLVGVIGFVMAFPCFFIVQSDERCCLLLFAGLAVNCVFWALIGVSSYRIFRRNGIKPSPAIPWASSDIACERRWQNTGSN